LFQTYVASSVACLKRILLDGTAGVTWRASAAGGTWIPLCAREMEQARAVPRAHEKQRGVGGPRVRTVNRVCERLGASSAVISTSNLFRTWENQPNRVEIYVRISIGQSGGARR
jgi:hypothetical protein